MKRSPSIALRLPPVLRSPRASVLVIVMVTLIFTALALTAFLEKAGNDLIVEAREADTRRLRQEAYSALETTLAVIEQFRAVTNGLHTPAEGWNDPLTFAGYVPTEGRTVEVSFEDESGKLSLPQANANQLQNLFIAWGLTVGDSEKLTDAFLGWIKRNHTYSTSLNPAYGQATLPYVEPRRSLRSYSELAAIEFARTIFSTTRPAAPTTSIAVSPKAFPSSISNAPTSTAPNPTSSPPWASSTTPRNPASAITSPAPASPRSPAPAGSRRPTRPANSSAMPVAPTNSAPPSAPCASVSPSARVAANTG